MNSGSFTESNQPVLTLFSSTISTFLEKVSANGPRLDDFMQATSVVELTQAIRVIEEEQAKRKSLRNLARIRPFLDAINQYASVVDVLVSAKPEILALIWGPIKFCLQAASKFAKAFDALLDAYKKIGDYFPIVAGIQSLFQSDLQIQTVLADVYKDILTFHERAISFFEKPGWKIALKITCRPFENLFGDILKNLERSRQLLFTSADVIHFSKAQEARFAFEEEFRRQREADEKQRRLTVLEWLWPTANLRDQHIDLQLRRKLYPGTAQWVFDEHIWKDWLYTYRDTNRLLWISGIPGAGKTVLFSSIVDYLCNEYECHLTDKAVTFFYCKYNDSSRNQYSQLAKSLIVQLLGSNANCLDYLYDKVLESGEFRGQTKQKYEEIILSMIQCYKKVWIGIDGLDECEQSERKDILSLIHNLIAPTENKSDVKVFLASRAERDIELSPGLSKPLVIKDHHLKNDISKYLQKEAKALREKFDLPEERLRSIVSLLSQRSKDMFLFARLTVENLLCQSSREDLLEELESEILPEDIDQVYDRILIRVQKHKSAGTQRRARQLLELLVSTRRVLQLHEIQAVFSIRLSDKSIDFENRECKDHLKTLCGPIVEVSESNRVELAHETAKIFLESCHSRYVPSFTPSLSITEICISYLTFDCFKRCLSDEELRTYALRGVYGFQDYAINNWIPHVQSLQAELGIQNPDVKRLLQKSNEVLLLHYRGIAESLRMPPGQSQAVHEDESVPDVLSRIQEPLSTVKTLCDGVQNNVIEIFRLLLRTRSVVETAIEDALTKDPSSFLIRAHGSYFFKCPYLTCPKFHEGFSSRTRRDDHKRKHERIFKCMEPDCDFRDFGFPSQAELNAHTKTFHGQPVLALRFANLKPRSLWAALEDSIDGNDPCVVKSLCLEILESGNEHGAMEKKGFILRAIKKAKFDAARVLIELLGDHSELIFKDTAGRTALFYAAKSGLVDLVELILTKGPSTLLQLGVRDTPMTIAASKGHLEVVRIMVENLRHENLNLGFEHLWTPLGAAVSTGQEKVVELLLENQGAEYVQSPYFEKALNAAASRNSEELVRKLLESGQELDAQRRYSKKLSKTIENNDLDAAIEFLLKKCKAGNFEESSERKIFRKAVRSGMSDEIERLLDDGINIDRVDKGYGTALSIAVGKKQEVVVRLLLDRGATADAHGNLALCVAARLGLHGIASILIEAGADVNVSSLSEIKIREAGLSRSLSYFRSQYKLYNGSYVHSLEWPPLHFAAHEKQHEMVQLLLEKGADAYAVNPERATALHLATSVYIYVQNVKDIRDSYVANSILTAQILLKYKVDINAKNQDGKTPLHLVEYRLSDKNYPEIAQVAKFLIQHGADIDVPDKDGVTPRKIAADAGEDILEQFLQAQQDYQSSKLQQEKGDGSLQL